MSCPALFDLFLDLPHPSASKSCPPVRLMWLQEGHPAELSALKDLPITISRFAFPEYAGPNDGGGGAGNGSQQQLRLNKYDYYAMQNQGFQQFTFTLQLQSGMRLHGHVRRYLPATPLSEGGSGGKFCPRYDVGRRGERALVLLTRAGGADRLSAAILKSIQVLQGLVQQQLDEGTDAAAASEGRENVATKSFLFALAAQQQQLASKYANKSAAERGRPLLAVLPGVEFGNHRYSRVDLHTFLVPPSLLIPQQASEQKQQQNDIMSSCSILPMLRCVGIANALRVLAALLCERRVVLVSNSPTRLTNCSHAVLAMLSCGLLQWQHLYIPVLPPHLWQYLAAPYPYLIGILAQAQHRLDSTDGLGEVMILNLDNNQMQARGMDTAVIAQRLPDLFVEAATPAAAMMSPSSSSDQGMAAASASEYLAQDLIALLKTDKRLLYGESSFQQNVGETAAKAAQSVKKTFMKLRDKGRQYMQQSSRSNSMSENDASGTEPQQEEVSGAVKSLSPDYIYTESCHNEVCEAEARVAFATFFLCMYGNMRWYLSASTTPGQAPQLDRNRFLQQKRAMGDGEGTPMWPLLQGFCQTQMLEEFAKAQVDFVQSRKALTPDAPLFAFCAQYHLQHNIDFGVLSVRRTARQVYNNSNIRIAGIIQTNARQNCMTLTSNKAFEGEYNKAVASLVEECRESTCVLGDVMSVLWLRLSDCKGGHWKHAFQSLQILRNLLYHGPLAVVAEATDGLDKIRALKYYENNMRQSSAQQVRTAAQVVYSLLVDRSRLFSIRRFCANRRLELLQTRPKVSKTYFVWDGVNILLIERYILI